jgi:hypothetical protein
VKSIFCADPHKSLVVFNDCPYIAISQAIFLRYMVKEYNLGQSHEWIQANDQEKSNSHAEAGVSVRFSGLMRIFSGKERQDNGSAVKFSGKYSFENRLLRQHWHNNDRQGGKHQHLLMMLHYRMMVRQ